MIREIEEFDNLVNRVANLLISQHKTIATAESCSGGLLSHVLTNVSGSSNYFIQGVVSYSNKAKIDLLNVSRRLIESYGAVNESVARAMAEGIRKSASVDIGISTTGIAGPTGGTKEKPIGLVFIGFSTNEETIVERYNFKGNRIDNKYKTVQKALVQLETYLKK